LLSKEFRNQGICCEEYFLRISRIIGFEPLKWLGLGGWEWRRIPKFLYSLDQNLPRRVFSRESRNLGICREEYFLRILRIIGFEPQTWLGLGGWEWKRIPKFL